MDSKQMIHNSENNQFVQGFLKLIGLTAYQSNEEFWEHLEKNHEEDILDQLEQALISHNDGKSNGDDLYEVKNQNLMLSLDVSNFSTDLYKQYFEWFIKHHIKEPKKILDLGCDNGLATCFYAILFPDSEVIGIDIKENGIRCAQSLAKKLNLTNVSFFKMDFRNILEHFSRNTFDLITSLRSLHEILGEFPVKSEDWFADNDRFILLNLVQILLKDELSEFISCERLSGENSISMWISLLKQAGLFVAESHFIDFHEIGQEQQMPVLVINQQKLITDYPKWKNRQNKNHS
jgi:SAM-dependent methyltransferase